MDEIENEKVHSLNFVHCAIPDLSLDEVNISYKIKADSTQIALKSPIVVLSKNMEEAKNLSKNRDVCTAFAENSNLHIFIKGKQKTISLSGKIFVRVHDGLEAAKILRLYSNAILFINADDADMLETFNKQLQIAMYLTNSKNIKRLGKAYVYYTKVNE